VRSWLNLLAKKQNEEKPCYLREMVKNEPARLAQVLKRAFYINEIATPPQE